MPVGVVKVFNGSIEVVETMIDGGIKIIGDSRLKNIKRYAHIPIKKMLIRLPMISQIKDLVELVDISLNSEIEVIKVISKESERLNKTHEVILMIEVGDLREGIYYEKEIIQTVKRVSKLPGIKLKGLGTNLNCFGSINPTRKNLDKLLKIRDMIKQELDVNLEVISGGNSGSLALIKKGEMPKGINQLRIGTAFFFGLIENSLKRIPKTHDDAFKLIAEIIEIKEKPSKPYGETGVDAFRNTPTFEDKGIRKRAICAIGRQDTDSKFLYPEDEEIEILGSSSDHLMLDITDCGNHYCVGDRVSFILDYMSLLKGMTSIHVMKKYI